jgi:adenylate kinase family enzyme
MRLVILTGASGSGKSTIAAGLKARLDGRLQVLHFDSIGVPSPAAMAAGWGSGEAWQRAMTDRWMADIEALIPRGQSILFEGQMRPSYLAAAVTGLSCECHVVLVDCSDEVRRERLTVHRRQPELANETMMRWAALLRSEADELGFTILETTGGEIDEALLFVDRLLAA